MYGMLCSECTIPKLRNLFGIRDRVIGLSICRSVHGVHGVSAMKALLKA